VDSRGILVLARWPKMATIDVIVDVKDPVEFVHKIIDATSGVSLVAFLENEATFHFHDDIESRFEEEGDVKSGFWKPLSDATVDIRRSYGFDDGPINVRTGEFKEFMLGDYDVRGFGTYAEMDVPGTPRDPILQAKLETAQQGRSTNPIPEFGPTEARPVLAVSEMDLMKLVELLEFHIVTWAVGQMGGTLSVV
jgi:hypothetical protein